MAYTTVHAPRGMPTDMGRMNNTKKKLVDSMEEFRKEGDRVNPTEEQVSLAEQLAAENDPSRYTKIQFDIIVQNNNYKDGYKEMMVTAFDVLFRYTVNMLKLKRPRNWYTIKFSNAQFSARADCMVGTRDILRLMGYTSPSYGEDKVTQTGLSYPDPSQINYDIIKLIGAELLTAKTEVKMAHEGRGGVVLNEGWYGSMQPPPTSTQMRPSYTEQFTYQGSHLPPQRNDVYPGYSPHQSGQPSEFGHRSVHQNEPRQDSWASQRSVDMYDSPYGRQDTPLSSSHNDQRHDYQPIMQTAQSENSSRTFSSQVSSPPDLNTSGGSSRLEALKQRKANAIKVFNENSGADITYNSPPPSHSTSQPVRHAPTAPVMVLREAPPQPKPRRNRPVPNQPTVNPPPTNPPSVNHPSDVGLPSSLPEAAPSMDVPVQKPHVPRPAVRFMMACNQCGYLNHGEKSQYCVECSKPKNEQWMRVEMPMKVQNVAPNNELSRPSPTSVATDDHHTQPSDRVTQSPTDTRSTPNRATAGAAAAASGTTSTPEELTKYLPPPRNYTPAQKAEMQRQAELARQHIDSEAEIQKMQQQEQHQPSMPMGDRGTSLNDYLPQNNQYNVRTKDGNNRPTGSALPPYDTSNDESLQHYKDLGMQGKDMVLDLKEGLRQGFQLEEIQLAAKIKRGRACDFLLKEWGHYVERTAFRINQISADIHKKKNISGNIGNPQRREVVQFLIEEHGDCEKAAQKCCDSRMKKIQELMREVNLPHAEVVMALERNGLNVDRAIHDIYQKKINSTSLYDYMWGKLEGGGIRQKQNDRIVQMITERVHRDDYIKRLLMAEYKLPTPKNCAVLMHLVRECNLTLGACLDVAMTNDDADTAKRLLTQQCPICCLEYTRNEMINLIHCDHAVCQECFVQHFTLVVGEKSIKHCNCLVCGEPDMSSDTIDMDLYLQMFSALIQANMAKEHYDMFTKKVNERTMMKDPGFRWCIKCSTGFINDLGRQKVECPNPECEQLMCFLCKKAWEPAHDGVTCEQFAQWEIDNDPELQAQGLAAYLNEEGIECPRCKFKYALAKGGCMHFKCTQCPTEFCSGCNELFKKDCTRFESCRPKGFHAHHPRDCLFYLRDENVDDLQKLLTDNNVKFDIDPPEAQVMAEANKEVQALQAGEIDQPALAPIAAAPVLKCRVLLQKENPDGPPMDEECGNPVQSGHAGLCEKHYKEYLVFKINQNHLDPLPLFEVNQLQMVLNREELKPPDKLAGEEDGAYKERLKEHITQTLPLKQRDVTNF